MRVITGSARGRKLKALEGDEVRPTTDMVKEAIFSIIQFDIEGSVVLDLFCGSGQLGIEAISRGAVVAGDFLAMEKREWKEDGGKILYNTQIVGEFVGEEVSPWAEITEDENGEITMMEMIRLKRV